VPTPQIVFDNNDMQEPLPPAIVMNASCEKTPVKTTKLSQTLFPVSNPKNTGSWIGENHKMLRALFRCMELSNCDRNQKKGAPPTFNLLGFKVYLISRHIGIVSFPGRILGVD
jgi:hypothetical protein